MKEKLNKTSPESVDSKSQQPPEKAADRLAVLERIEQLEREGRFDVDAEEDPPTLPLQPDQIDYLRVKPSSKVKVKLAYAVAEQFLVERVEIGRPQRDGHDGRRTCQPACAARPPY